jgi:retron-type reverse transcriptase
MSREDVRAIRLLREWRDWRGDLVPQNPFGPPVRIDIPAELASEAALLSHLGLSVMELKKIRWCRGRMYQSFDIANVKNKIREINAPDSRLKHLQRQLLPLLDQLYRVRKPVHGFVADRSVKTNALAHLRKHFVLNLDLKDFFPSITENRVVGVLKALDIDSSVAAVIGYLCCVNGQLPQGAPTSPVLSNTICFRLHRKLLAFAKDARCIYTRYADDITFSSYQPMTTLFEGPLPPAGHFVPDLLAAAFASIFVVNGFAINPAKAHYADRHSRRMVTGLKINELLNVDRKYVRNIRAALHSIETIGGIVAQRKFEARGGTGSLAAHLLGKLSWLRHIRGQTDPVFRSVAVRFNNTFPAHKIDVTPTPAEVRDRAVWVIEHYEGDIDQWYQGSAFFLRGVGLVTAAHCVTGASEAEVYHPGKPANKFKVTVLKVDDHRDLAILAHMIPETEYLELERSTKVITVGMLLTAVGYPSFGSGDRLNVRDGNVSSLPVRHGVQYIEVQQKLSPGMSGDPLLDAYNAVTGVVHKGGPSEPRDFAIHIDVLNAWLASASASFGPNGSA